MDIRSQSELDRREAEAARLEVAPPKPGDDPPTYGDEGGGSLYPESSFDEPLEASPHPLLRRLGRSIARRFSGPA
jgi:hypothetical protein